MNTTGIVQSPAPVLHDECAEVVNFAEFQGIADRLYGACRDGNRQGVAAPQIGVSVQAFAAMLSGSPYPVVLCNPTITNRWGTIVATEGCLSLADQWFTVERASLVNVTAYTRSGRKLELVVSGMDARVLQHEIDHLNGVLIIDRALCVLKNARAHAHVLWSRDGERRD